MGLLILLQVALDLAAIATVALLLIERSRSRSGEDPRISRGLQLLTSKIAILQDLMDRCDTMGRQLGQIIDRKQREVQEQLEDIDTHIRKVESSIDKSKEVAKIFEDKIPHKEIVERQTSLRYLQAAKLANQGFSIDDIASQVDVPRGELDLIVKLNRDQVRQNDPEIFRQTYIQNEISFQENQPENHVEPQKNIQNTTLNVVLKKQSPVQAQTESPSSPNHAALPLKASNAWKTGSGSEEIKPVVFRHISDTNSRTS